MWVKPKLTIGEVHRQIGRYDFCSPGGRPIIAWVSSRTPGVACIPCTPPESRGGISHLSPASECRPPGSGGEGGLGTPPGVRGLIPGYYGSPSGLQREVRRIQCNARVEPWPISGARCSERDGYFLPRPLPRVACRRLAANASGGQGSASDVRVSLHSFSPRVSDWCDPGGLQPRLVGQADLWSHPTARRARHRRG